MQQFLPVFALAAAVAVVLATSLASIVGRSGFPLPAGAQRLGCIDGLRGYLALSVMIHHSFIWIQATRLGGSWSAPSIHLLNQLGAGGVGLFFMTTGLVFYPRVLAGLRATSWLTVYVTRIFRIMPLVIITVSLVTAIIIARTGATLNMQYIGSAARWISAWSEPPILGYPDSGRINSYVLWSLWYEWLFYLLVLPISAGVMDIIRSRRLPTWVLPAMLFLIGLISRLIPNLPWSFGGVLFYLPLFAIGMFAFECQSRPLVRDAMSKPLFANFATAALLLGMVATETPNAISLPLFGIFFISVSCGNSLGGLLRSRGALVLGECSFGIYLLHGIVLDTLFVDAGALDELTTLALPLLLPIAAVALTLVTPAAYLLVERPAMRRGKALAHWLAGRHTKLDIRELDVAP